MKLRKNNFGNDKNDPRIIGVSSRSDGNKTIIDKGLFTSCNKEKINALPGVSAKRLHDKEKNNYLMIMPS